MANETDSDLRSLRVATPNLLRGDAAIIADALERDAKAQALIEQHARSAEFDVIAREAHARTKRLVVLAGVFQTLAAGRDGEAAEAYGIASEGF